MRHTYTLGAVAAALLAVSGSAYAQLDCAYSYGIQTTVDGTAGVAYCSSNSKQFIDYVEDLADTHPNYTTSSAADVAGRFNDVDIALSYAANSNTLVFSAPEIGVAEQTFTGSSRKNSQTLFTDWLKREGIIGKIMQYQAQHSAASPITGAGGLMPTIAAADYSTGSAGSSNISGSTITTTSGNVLGIGASFGSYSVEGSSDRVETMTLPLSYTNKLDSNPKHEIVFSLPVSMYKVGNAKGYHIGAGVAYRFPVTGRWTLTPGVRYSLTGSVDRATVASVNSFSLMSSYTVPFERFELTFGNMAGYYKTGKFKAGEYSFNPNISQTMLRNGIMLSQPVQVKGRKLAIEYSAIDTRYVGGSKPFMRNMQEYGITAGLHRDDPVSGKWSALRAGISYTRATGANGFAFNFGYWF